ncbi:MAG: hypothetical protein E7021_02410 [Alphaproteobacteria bacterium]|nr:hypothetical protein [Alphaproteobacteria bacterium]
MTAPKRPYIIICEGNSEYAYIQKLNRFLVENNYNFTLIAKIVGTGHYKSVQKKYLYEHKNNPKLPIKIWVDKDTYVRNDEGDRDNYEHKSSTDFLFSIMNFEDFLALHTDEKTLENWFQICSRKRHHISPMKEAEYLPLVKEHLFPNYTKGDIPFEITSEKLEQLFKQKNNPKYFFRCGFADLLEELMKESKKSSKSA